MKSLILCCAIITTALLGAAQAQGDLTDETRCNFRDIPDCRVRCFLRDDDGCPNGCNATCNEVECPDMTACTLGCGIFEIDDDGCRECECDDCPEEEDDEVCACYRRDDDGCRICITDTSDCALGERNECETDSDCDSGECYTFGQNGVRRCRERLAVGMPCRVPEEDGDEDDDDEEESSFSFGIECVEDSFCSPESEVCVAITGRCPERNRNITQEEQRFECEDDGTFETRQCRRVEPMDGGDNGEDDDDDDDDDTRGELVCRCVNPEDGTPLDGEPFRVRDDDDDDDRAPDCDDRVFRPCLYALNNRRYTVRHGESTVILDRCQRCRCSNGTFEGCRDVDATRCANLNGARPCEFNGQTYEHGERFEITNPRIGVCNRGGCYNGRVVRTRNRCDDDSERDECEICEDERSRMPVCGPDGRTYRSECIARQCAGLERGDYRPGRCRDLDICRLFPCRAGQRCVDVRDEPCFQDGGCRSSVLRRCINVTELTCGRSDASEAVCDTEGRSHDSLCRLPQETADNVQILHRRRCDDRECAGGMVCGTDGVTYENDCHRRTRSARARRDYMGECDDEPDDEDLTELCARIRSERRCRWNATNCENLVRTREGCCPVCGGGIYIANDPDAMRDFADFDDDFDIDSYSGALERIEVIARDIIARCEVEVTPTGNRDIEVTFTARDSDQDATFCYMQSVQGADAINEVTPTEEVPQQLAFATAASPSTILDSGAPKLAVSLLLLLAASLAFLLF